MNLLFYVYEYTEDFSRAIRQRIGTMPAQGKKVICPRPRNEPSVSDIFWYSDLAYLYGTLCFALSLFNQRFM